MSDSEIDSPDSVPTRSWWADIGAATQFLTRLRWGADDDAGAFPASAMRAFPLVGAAIGLAGGIVYFVGSWLGLPPFVAALIALGATIALTGALHEDGLADAADSLGATNPDDRIAVMRDGSIGAYGVLALVLGVLLRAGAIAALESPGLVIAAWIAAGAASRAAIPVVMRTAEAARADGLAAAIGPPSAVPARTAAALGIAIALLFAGPWAGIVALGVGACAAAGAINWARRTLGGYTGDVLGTVQQVTEIAILLAIVSF